MTALLVVAAAVLVLALVGYGLWQAFRPARPLPHRPAPDAPTPAGPRHRLESAHTGSLAASDVLLALRLEAEQRHAAMLARAADDQDQQR